MTFPTIIVEAGFNVGPSTSTYLHLDDPSRGKLDSATLAPDEVWSDISPYVRSISTRIGASIAESPVLRYDAGSMTVVVNNSDRRFDPTNLAGPYVSGGVTQVNPMTAIRFRAMWNGLTYEIWRGFIDKVNISYKMPNYSEVSFPCTDATRIISDYKRTAVTGVGASEDTGARINRILDSANWSATDRLISTGDTTVQATTLEGDAWAEAVLVNDTEIGELYIDPAGRVFFRNRKAVTSDARSNVSQATFGDGGGAELAYIDVTPIYDAENLANLVKITPVGGTEQVATDTASVAAYLTHTFERSDLIMEDDGSAYAGFVLYQSKDPELRFDRLVVNPRTDETNLFPQILSRKIGDRITVMARPPGGGSAINRDVFIRGISHDVVSDLTWLTTYTLQSATRYAFLVLDNATLGKLDSNALGF